MCRADPNLHDGFGSAASGDVEVSAELQREPAVSGAFVVWPRGVDAFFFFGLVNELSRVFEASDAIVIRGDSENRARAMSAPGRGVLEAPR